MSNMLDSKMKIVKILFIFGILIDLLGFFLVMLSVMGTVSAGLMLPGFIVFISGILIMVVSRFLSIMYHKEIEKEEFSSKLP